MILLEVEVTRKAQSLCRIKQFHSYLLHALKMNKVVSIFSKGVGMHQLPFDRVMLRHKGEGIQQNAMLRDIQIIATTLISCPAAGDGSEVKSACFSFRGPKVSYQHHVEWLPITCNSSSKGVF